MASLHGTETVANLKEAFLRESQANRRYLWFAQRADIDGRPEVAALFRSIAETETGHAYGLLEFLAEVGDPITGEPIGDTDENLAAAIAGERFDCEQLYPQYARTAREEGFDAVAEWFETQARAEHSQLARLERGREEL